MQFSNGHFKKCNEWLAERYGPDEVIDWSLTPATSTIAPSAPHIPHPQTDGAKSNVENTTEAPTLKEDNKTAKTSRAAEEFEDDLDAFEALVETASTS